MQQSDTHTKQICKQNKTHERTLINSGYIVYTLHFQGLEYITAGLQ